MLLDDLSQPNSANSIQQPLRSCPNLYLRPVVWRQRGRATSIKLFASSIYAKPHEKLYATRSHWTGIALLFVLASCAGVTKTTTP
jgi:hypothetical protein